MLSYLHLLARLALGSVWMLAGASKLSRRKPARQSVADFGLLPGFLANSVASALPWVELTLAVLFLLGQSLVWASMASLALLLVFSLAIALNLARGRHVECHCFGQFGRSQISWRSVTRNLTLTVPAALILLSPSDYLTFQGWRRGTALLPTDPSPLEFVPVLLMAVAVLATAFLGMSAWTVLKAIANVNEGPAPGMRERSYLRRWMKLEQKGLVRRGEVT